MKIKKDVKVRDLIGDKYLRVKSMIPVNEFKGLTMEPMLFNNYMILRDRTLVGVAMASDIAKFMFPEEEICK